MNIRQRLGKVGSAVSIHAGRRKLACVAFAAGLGTFLALGVSFVVPLAAAIVLTLAVLGIAVARRRGAFGCALMLIVLFFNQYAALRVVQPEGRTDLRSTLTGTVCKDAVAQPESERVVVTLADAVREDGALAGKVRLYVYGTTDAGAFVYGDRLTISRANVTVPKGRTNPGGFDFAAYLWRGGVTYCATASWANVEIAAGTPSLRRGLSRLRAGLSARLDELYGENADVMRAILLGDRSQISDETYEDFRNTGIAHLIALSGMHVTCIAFLIGALLRGLLVPRRVASAITAGFLGLYAIMTGLSPSVVRAVMMYAMMCLTRECGYPDDLLTRLGLAFLIQLSIQPLNLMDTGFQLSYISVLALACLGKPLANMGGKVRGRLRRAFRATWTTSLAAQLGTLPLICSQFYSVPLLALPVNLIALPVGLMTVFTGAVSLALTPLCLPLARIFAYPGAAAWTAMRSLMSAASGLPLAVIAARGWPVALGTVYFLVMLLLSPYFGRGGRLRRWGFAVFPVLFALALIQPRDLPAGMRITFLDVNYGDSAVIDMGTDTYVIDCGKDNGILADYLTQAGAVVKGVFVTHPDTDHAGGLNEILRRWSYAAVYVPDCWDELNVGDALEETLKDAKVRYLTAGDTVALGKDAAAEVLWPTEGFVPKEDNDGCLVLRVRYGETRTLFMADVTDKYDALAAADCDVIKVAHHGSKYATTAEMLDIASPRYAVISVASNNYGHPTPEVLSRLEDAGALTLRTDECGAIIMNFAPDGTIDVTTMLASEELYEPQ